MDPEDRKKMFLVHYIVYCFNFSTKNQVLELDFNSLKSGLLHLTSQLKSRAAKVKDGIRN
jgi:hypothetical protein